MPVAAQPASYASVPTTSFPGQITTTGQCGVQGDGTDTKLSCPSTGDTCCGAGGYCGSGPLFCNIQCQKKYGLCNPNQGDNPISTDGTCGLQEAGNGKGFQCAPSGNFICCSSTGHCGAGDLFCDPDPLLGGCQTDFGVCKTDNIVASKDPATKTTINTTTLAPNGKCGTQPGEYNYGFHCNVNSSSPCCSRDGWCGSGS